MSEKTLKIIAVCGFGIGSSVILKIKLEEALAALHARGDVEVSDIMTASSKRGDILFTSTAFIGQLRAEYSGDAPLIAIHNFMDSAEIQEKLQKILAG